MRKIKKIFPFVLSIFANLYPDCVMSRNGCPATFDCETNNRGECSLNCSTCSYDCGTTIFIPRSQGSNTARELVGWQRQLYAPFYVENYVALAGSVEYTKSFKSERIANRLFCTSCLTFAGSQAPRNNGVDIVADNFGLPTNFRQSLAIKPKIENFIFDINLYFGLDEIARGFYVRLHAPLTHTRWCLGLDDCVACVDKFRGDDRFPSCYMYSQTPVTLPTMPPDQTVPPAPTTDINTQCFIHNAVNPNVIIEPIQSVGLTGAPYDCTTHCLREALSGDFTFGDMTERWKFGRFDFCARDKTKLADLDVIIGYNFCKNDFYHFGLYGIITAPTGNRPKAKYIFEPIAGNGKHWELGVGLSYHYTIFDDMYIDGFATAFYFEGSINNVFKNKQRRSFDFKQNGLLSRYSLLKEYDINNNYIGRMINAINFATRDCEVSVGYKIDLSAKIVFRVCGWELDFGYNLFAQNGETVCIKTDCPCDIDLRRFAFKGVTGVCATCFQVADINGIPTIFSGTIPDTATAPAGCPELILAAPNTSTVKDNTDQPNATMFNVIPLTSAIVPSNACTVNLSYASAAPGSIDVAATDGGTPVSQLTAANGFIVLDQSCTVQSSGGTSPVISGTSTANPKATPRIISCADLDPNSAAQPAMFTNKFFAHFGYIWADYCYEPHLGVGGEVEVDGRRLHNSLNQWGVWIKGGITF